MDDEREMGRSVARRKTASNLSFCVKKERDGKYRKVYAALQKKDADLTEEEKQLLCGNAELVKKARESLKKREEVKARSEEVEDPDEVLLPKCAELAAALRSSRHLVVYTGAGISTAAKIPDYRGSNGIWTLLQKGKDIGKHDLSQAEPTLTHMALFELYSQGMLKYVVSQNCDGLHLRSGLPRSALSEVHGNMHLEVCPMCRPTTQYWRMFDVTENTGRFSHRTMRRCHFCHSALIDTIVHFGERGNLPWPLNWPAASKAANNADTILCIGSSLKVLKRYPWLWGMDKPVRKRPKLYIINLQWTPKDDQAVLKINGRCDRVMQEVLKCLGLKVPEYSRLRDPIFCHATHLHVDEMHTTSQPELDSPHEKQEKHNKIETTIYKQGLKRGNDSDEADCSKKVRRVDSLEAKQEPQDNCCINEGSFNSHCKQEEKSEDSSQLVDKEVKQSDILCGRGTEDSSIERSSFDIRQKEVKQEQPDNDQTVLLIQTEEVIGQIIESRNGNDCGSDSRESVFVRSTLSMEKKEDDSKSSGISCDQTIAVNVTLSPKVNCENQTADLQSIDGKENLVVAFTKLSYSESVKSSKKLDVEKLSDSNDSEKSSRAHILVSNCVQSVKVEPLLDCFASLKSQKICAKNSFDVFEDEVVVLKMLQLEHNYSKSIDENHDGKGLDPKEVTDVRKESKPSKNDSKSSTKEAVKRNLRRTSRDAVNYLEIDEEEEEEDSDDEGETKSGPQTLRTSRRTQAKPDTNQQSKSQLQRLSNLSEDKQQNKEGSQKKDSEKKAHEKSSSVKSNKPITPLKNKKLTKADFEMRAELKSRQCGFCLNFYQSKLCMFYPSLDFRPRKIQGCICECCDYSSDSEEADEEGSNGETNEGKGDSTDNADEGSSKSSIINPGWYGKGYRKRLRKKK